MRENVSDGDEDGRADHGARVVALRVFDFLRDGGGVVPAHVVPESDEDSGGERGGGDGLGPLHGGMHGDAVPDGEAHEDGEGREQKHEHADGALADGGRAAKVPETTEDNDGERPGVGAPVGGERGRKLAEIEDEDGRVDGHVEDAGGE